VVSEALGCLLLLWRWRGEFETPLAAAYISLFHSISAFCNAGFALRAGSLRGVGPAGTACVLVLLVLGGLGFVTLLELGRSLRRRRSGARRFSLHARIVLLSSLLLLAGGAVPLALIEGEGWGDALFMSATARTAGFETVSVRGLSGASLLVLMFLMFIGASPGSTGGGIKTTTFVALLGSLRATLRGEPAPRLLGREIPDSLVRRAFAVAVSSLLVVFGAVLLIVLFEPGGRGGFLGLAFEVVSAFGTVGLSTGVTPHLTAASKVLLCAVMFVGRVGSLSFFLLLLRDASPSRVRYPEERVQIG
ncbi:MAG: potassium transporter TrkG, partial [Planctomycetota bacterium]